MIPKGATVLVGYSGGADSTALLYMLKLLDIDVVAAHLHHGQREGAEKELRLCQAFADQIGVPFVSGRADVPRLAKDMKWTLEEAGRHARYAFFEQSAQRLGCALIATGHTEDDHVETVLLHLARGSGLSGLGGISAERGNIVRPILVFSRAETRQYCSSKGFWTHDDPSNSDVVFSRARVRHRILPEFQAINPGFSRAVVRLAAIASEEDHFLNGAAASSLALAALSLNGHLEFLTKTVEISLSLAKLGQLPAVLFKRSVRLLTEALGATLDFDQTERVANLVRDGLTGSITAEGGKVVVEIGETLVVRQLQPTQPFRFSITLPGETESDEFGWKFSAFSNPAEPAPSKRDSLAIDLDADCVKGQLFFRTAEAGDKIQPVGFEGHRKLSDLMSEARLTQAARQRLPIVCDLIGPIWAPGVCFDERVRLTERTNRILQLQFGPHIPD